jgi:hypothetical protein
VLDFMLRFLTPASTSKFSDRARNPEKPGGGKFIPRLAITTTF